MQIDGFLPKKLQKESGFDEEEEIYLDTDNHPDKREFYQSPKKFVGEKRVYSEIQDAAVSTAANTEKYESNKQRKVADANQVSNVRYHDRLEPFTIYTGMFTKDIEATNLFNNVFN